MEASDLVEHRDDSRPDRSRPGCRSSAKYGKRQEASNVGSQRYSRYGVVAAHRRLDGATHASTASASGTLLHVLELAVDESHRGRGSGSALVRAAIAEAVRAGDVEVTVPTRRASGFYRRLGFIESAAYLTLTPSHATDVADCEPESAAI